MIIRSFIRPYNMSSKSSFLLAKEMGLLRVSGERRLKGTSIVVNWGGTKPIEGRVLYLNDPMNVTKAIDKVATFHILTAQGILSPAFTADKQVALSWLTQGKVYARTKLRAKAGEGIVVCTDTLADAPLYTKGIKVKDEYRVHVVSGKVIDFTIKKKRRDTDIDLNVRNSAGGWVFCRDGVTLPDVISDAATASIEALGLHFGALDVALGIDGLAYVFEVNTAPGIEGTTLNKYKQALGELIYETKNQRQLHRLRNRMYIPQIQQSYRDGLFRGL